MHALHSWPAGRTEFGSPIRRELSMRSCRCLILNLRITTP